MAQKTSRSFPKKVAHSPETAHPHRRAEGPIRLWRDCEAIQIPSGHKVLLPAGTYVTITQSLHGAYTVMTEHGDIVGIAPQDVDALGPEVAATRSPRPPGPEQGPTDLEHLIWAQLKTCLDPEIPFNIVDLGLVYGCHLIPLPQGGYKVEVAFTLTSPTCGMGEWLKADIASKLLSVPGVTEVNVQIVFEPPWDQSRMSEEAKRELGLI